MQPGEPTRSESPQLCASGVDAIPRQFSNRALLASNIMPPANGIDRLERPFWRTRSNNNFGDPAHRINADFLILGHFMCHCWRAISY